MLAFQAMLKKAEVTLTRRPLEILQVNVGKLCNQTCRHCHVDAGPRRKEIMERATAERILELLQKAPMISTVDITGGAPELNPYFRFLVEECRGLQRKVIDRCNLSVFFQPGHEDTAQFLAREGVQIIASLPCYTEENVDMQRGKGVFVESVHALRLLNELGYGKPKTGLDLHLVYNPVGPYLPDAQAKLEADYKRELENRFGILFNRLFTITNMPIARFLSDLRHQGKLDEYMTLLVENFNPHAAENVMCRDLISIGWNGEIYDCDFNQMLEIPLGGKHRSIWDIDSFDALSSEPIAFENHCYGCTAGAGSSCSGATA